MKKILVLGDLIIDRFIYGETTKLGADAPYPVFKPLETTENWGGAGNVVNNLKSLAPDWKIDYIMNDEHIIKSRYVDMKSNYILMRLDENDQVSRIGDAVLNNLIENLNDYDGILLSDYSKGFLDKPSICKIAKRAKELNIPTFLDTKFLLGEWSKDIFIVKINEVEWKYNLRNNVNPAEYCQNLIVTLSERGAVYRGNIYPAYKVDVIDSSGLGDSMICGLCVSYLKFNDIEIAINDANRVASIAASRKGVVTVKGSEVWPIV